MLGLSCEPHWMSLISVETPSYRLTLLDILVTITGSSGSSVDKLNSRLLRNSLEHFKTCCASIASVEPVVSVEPRWMSVNLTCYL